MYTSFHLRRGRSYQWVLGCPGQFPPGPSGHSPHTSSMSSSISHQPGTYRACSESQIDLIFHLNILLVMPIHLTILSYTVLPPLENPILHVILNLINTWLNSQNRWVQNFAPSTSFLNESLNMVGTVGIRKSWYLLGPVISVPFLVNFHATSGLFRSVHMTSHSTIQKSTCEKPPLIL